MTGNPGGGDAPRMGATPFGHTWTNGGPWCQCLHRPGDHGGFGGTSDLEARARADDALPAERGVHGGSWQLSIDPTTSGPTEPPTRSPEPLTAQEGTNGGPGAERGAEGRTALQAYIEIMRASNPDAVLSKRIDELGAGL